MPGQRAGADTEDGLTAEEKIQFRMNKLFLRRDEFRSKIQISQNGCHIWTGTIVKKGYGHFSLSDVPIRAHRAAWILKNGAPIPPGMHVCHRCDVRNCVNPEHLFLSTNKGNVEDCIKKGRRAHSIGKCKLTPEQRAEVRTMYEFGTISQNKLGLRFGVSEAVIFKAVRNVLCERAS